MNTISLPDANEEIHLNKLDSRTDMDCWDGVTKAVENAQKLGLDLEELQNRVRDEWDTQQENGE